MYGMTFLYLATWEDNMYMGNYRSFNFFFGNIYIYFFYRNFATHFLDNIIIPASNSSLLFFKQQQSVIIFFLGEPHPEIKNNKKPTNETIKDQHTVPFFDFDFPFRRTDSGFRSSSGQPWCDLSIYKTITQQRLKARSIIWKLKLGSYCVQLHREENRVLNSNEIVISSVLNFNSISCVSASNKRHSTKCNVNNLIYREHSNFCI